MIKTYKTSKITTKTKKMKKNSNKILKKTKKNNKKVNSKKNQIKMNKMVLTNKKYKKTKKIEKEKKKLIKKVKYKKMIKKQMKKVKKKTIKNKTLEKKIKNCRTSSKLDTRYKRGKLEIAMQLLILSLLIGGNNIPAGRKAKLIMDMNDMRVYKTSTMLEMSENDKNVSKDKWKIFQLDGSPKIHFGTSRNKKWTKSDTRKGNRSRFFPATKLSNRQKIAYNGNRNESYKIGHWNGGSRMWKNKLLELEIMLGQMRPDLCYITEANLWKGTPPHEKEIEGYRLVLPKTLNTMNHARIILLVREGINIEILNDYMDGETATIWVKLGSRRSSAITLGGIYREQHQLGMTDPNATWQDVQTQQENRWKKIVENWARAGRNRNCITLGDMNLDHLRWQAPKQCHVKMVEQVQG